LRRFSKVIVFAVCDIHINFDSGKQVLLMGLFLERFVGDSECTNGVDIDKNWQDFYLFKVVNFRQILDFTILRKHATSVKICSVTNNASLVDVTISTTVSVCKLRNHLNFTL
jgi:hypothetical protein